ncbi:MAG TPA: ATP-binding protein [Desulfobacterales bacterium]|nr:ATP-binding protein [Desulfobacterales bacterium]
MSAEKEFDRRLEDLRRKAEARLVDASFDQAFTAGGHMQRLLHDLHVHQIELEMQNEELRAAQGELQHARDRYLELYHNAPVGYVVTDSAGMILQANQTFGHLLDQDLAGVLRKPLAGMIHADDQAVFLSRFRAFYKNPLNKRLEVRMTRKDRSVVHTQLAGRRIAPPGDSVPGDDPPGRLLLTISDITAQKLAERAIIRAKTQWEQTFDAVPDLIAIINERSDIVRVNRALARRLGLTPQACVGRKCYHVLHERGQRPAGCPHQRLLTSGRPGKTETFNRKLGGHFITTVAPFNNDEEGARWCIHISHDITDRKRVERELLKSRNLESIGTLAGGMAHDFNNILTALVGNIEMLKLHLVENEKAQPFLDGAMAATFKVKDLANRLLTFAEGGAPYTQPIAIDRLLEETAQLSLSGSNVTYELQLGGPLTPLIVEEVQVKSALQNIIQNAREAMPGGGRLLLKARNVTLAPESDPLMAPGTYVRIEICDQGCGIRAAHLDKIFDPYFTTKQMGSQKGMGLGLAISHSIIRKHHGHIAVGSTEGQGTRVTIHLPVNGRRRPSSFGRDGVLSGPAAAGHAADSGSSG